MARPSTKTTTAQSTASKSGATTQTASTPQRKRGRPRLSEAEKARRAAARKAEKKAASKAAKKAAKKPTKRIARTARTASTPVVVTQRAKGLYSEAGDITKRLSKQARKATEKGKDKAAQAVGSAAQLLEEKADDVGRKYGAKYGNYTRRAANKVGQLAEVIEETHLEDVTKATRKSVKKQPLTSIAIAAVAGFVFARLISRK